MSLHTRLTREIPPTLDAMIAAGQNTTATTIAIRLGALPHQVSDHLDRHWRQFAPREDGGGWRNATHAERTDLTRVRR